MTKVAVLVGRFLMKTRAGLYGMTKKPTETIYVENVTQIIDINASMDNNGAMNQVIRKNIN